MHFLKVNCSKNHVTLCYVEALQNTSTCMILANGRRVRAFPAISHVFVKEISTHNGGSEQRAPLPLKHIEIITLPKNNWRMSVASE